jgi:hypothetical protein
MIKAVEVGVKVMSLWQFALLTDFDYIVFQDDDGKIGFFEAFYPENVVVIGDVGERAAVVTYAEAAGAFLVVLESGKLRMIAQAKDINPSGDQRETQFKQT